MGGVALHHGDRTELRIDLYQEQPSTGLGKVVLVEMVPLKIDPEPRVGGDRGFEGGVGAAVEAATNRAQHRGLGVELQARRCPGSRRLDRPSHPEPKELLGHNLGALYRPVAPMAEDLMRYDQLAQEALRSVVRVALERAGEPDGLPGQHHFYLTFKTAAEGVAIPIDLRAKYPDEMTIVLKSRFWDLVVEAEKFSVKLTFNGVPAELEIPYSAITRFFDPTVPFGLQFDVEVAEPVAVVDAPPSPVLDEASDEDTGGEVLSLDAFRKK